MVESGLFEKFEQGILDELRGRNIPVIVVFNKSDLAKPQAVLVEELKKSKTPFVETVAPEGPRPSRIA